MSGWRKRRIAMGDFGKYNMNYNGITYTVTVGAGNDVRIEYEPEEDLGDLKEAREYLECLMKKR